MSIDDELLSFYQANGFGDEIGERPRFVEVYTGCLLVPMPNIEARRTFLKYHDLHHLITGYSTGRIGEGEMSAWELGAGSMRRNPLIGIMNLVALSTGWALDRRRIRAAYLSGLRSTDLYGLSTRQAIDDGAWASVAELSKQVLHVKPDSRNPLRTRFEYGLYVGVSLIMHAAVAIPAVLMRYAADVRRGHGLLGALRPDVRMDIY